MKRMITLLLALAICFGLMPVAAFAQAMPFTDVPEDAFYYDAVAWAVEEEITTGMTPTTFGPDVSCTRGHVVTFLWRLAGYPKPQGDTMPFVDVELSEYYTDAILWAVEQGITKGMDATHFDPQGECTRAQIVVFLWRFFGMESAEGLNNPFTDVVSGEWYTSAIVWASAKAITNGMPNQTFAFADTCTRGQVVTFLYRAAKLMEEPEEPVEPSEEATEPSETPEPGLKLKEDASTVTRGDMLRASTYALTSVNNGTSTQAATTKTLKYFDVTMYDYDMDTINAATMNKEASDSDVYEGFYFSNGNAKNEQYSLPPEITEKPVTYAELANRKDGEYLIYIESANASSNLAERWVSVGTSNKIVGKAADLATLWTLEKRGNDTYLYTTIEGTKYYLDIRNGGSSSGSRQTSVIVEKTAFTLHEGYSNNNAVRLYHDGYYLNQFGGSNATVYDGYDSNADRGSNMYIYDAKPYAGYNYWNKVGTGGDNDYGQKFYTDLVKNTLVDNQIQFNMPEGGIFNNDSSVKTIYSHVEMPFVYDAEERSYTFDSAQYGVYFHQDADQNSTLATEAEKKLRLYFNETTRQEGNTYGDGSIYHWLPFNNATKITTDTDKNYHFGMVARIPFTMTTNGRLSETNDNSDAITFEFSGDDDVWVFIDNQLVIDLGGIHNRLDATINFATGVVTYSESNSLNIATGSFNESAFSLTQQLYNNLISEDLTSFAADDNHVLSVFYLERGMGASNCKIKFNLPMKDSLTVTKKAEHYWDGKSATTLNEKDKALVDAMDFNFTLYKSVNAGEDISPVNKASYILLNADGSVNAKLVTNEYGQFTLKNGQSAKFITEFDENTCFYVEETQLDQDIFWAPDFSYSGTATNGFAYKKNGTEADWTSVGGNASSIADKEENDDWSSHRIIVKGSTEAADNLNIICRNFVKNDLPNPSVRPNPDKLVIDYGLKVEIPVADILANDFYNGNDFELVAVSGDGMAINGTKTAHTIQNGSINAYKMKPTANTNDAKTQFGSVELSADGATIIYTLEKQMTGVEVLNYMVRTHDDGKQLSGDDVILYDAAIANIYIIPATTMYYEEDFDGLVTYGDGWKAVTTTGHSDKQETGLVDTTKKWSPYGSDVAYQDDAEDSNGTSMYVDTTKSSATFSYTFTGTGTSFFARTRKDTGYLKIEVKDSDGESVDFRYRDTAWLQEAGETYENSTLYNIPVYTLEDLNYGTYIVTVTVAKHSEQLQTGKNFWLDGIRIVSPLNPEDKNINIALDAYHQDGESEMQSITLRQKLLNNAKLVEKKDENGDPVVNEDGDSIYELTWDDGFVVFTDSNGEIVSAEDYNSIGPKEEVYLDKGQSVSFSVVTSDTSGYKLFLGMKAPFGSGTVQVGNTTYNLRHAADCYYDVTGNRTITQNTNGTYTCTYTITATDCVVSLTNIKVTDSMDIELKPTVDIENPGNSGGDENVNVD